MRQFGRRELLGSVSTAAAAAVFLAACGESGDGEPNVDDEDFIDPEPFPGDTLPGDSGETVAPQTLAPVFTTPGTVATSTTPTPPSTVAPSTAPPTTLPAPSPAPDPGGSEGYLQIGTISIPKLKIKEPLGVGVTIKNIDRGPGYWPGTALPGKQGNVVIAGHRTSGSAPFRNMHKLGSGDEVILETGDGRFVYRVKEVFIVDPTALEIIDQTPDYTATLFACHPPGSVKKRIVTRCVLAT